ncbi:interleukin-5 receptor subunit alpha-like [Polypterus senegalus]|nr:interleukin-5 receptor subunit alpha-like [Polypterus senegalus]XP_039628880.1 interleukin-5 receptor subunit alpha-like [Polypterus senegalus]XP_039628881.1 interleukin-5 receptor subunit alpha-like [Polypterus senegalus]XP_039628882.1 interleukin-5 receptor subunit alpha-like [Polypterus senegalus]
MMARIVLLVAVLWLSTLRACSAHQGRDQITIRNLGCLVYALTSMNCSWTTDRNVSGATNFTVQLRTGNSDFCCVQVKRAEDSFFCHFPRVTFQGRDVQVNVGGSSDSFTIKEERTAYEVLAILKPSPPCHVQAVKRKKNIEITWQEPLVEYGIQQFMDYEIWSSYGYLTTVSSPKNLSLVIPVEDLKLPVAFRLLTRGNEEYPSSGHPSEWSQWTAMIYSEEAESEKWKLWGIGVGLTLALVVCLTVIVLCVRFAVMDKMFPPIPDPKDKLKALLETPNDPSSAWLMSVANEAEAKVVVVQ